MRPCCQPTIRHAASQRILGTQRSFPYESGTARAEFAGHGNAAFRTPATHGECE